MHIQPSLGPVFLMTQFYFWNIKSSIGCKTNIVNFCTRCNLPEMSQLLLTDTELRLKVISTDKSKELQPQFKFKGLNTHFLSFMLYTFLSLKVEVTPSSHTLPSQTAALEWAMTHTHYLVTGVGKMVVSVWIYYSNQTSVSGILILSLQFFRSVQSTCTELLKVIEKYQHRITREWQLKLNLLYISSLTIGSVSEIIMSD